MPELILTMPAVSSAAPKADASITISFAPVEVAVIPPLVAIRLELLTFRPLPAMVTPVPVNSLPADIATDGFSPSSVPSRLSVPAVAIVLLLTATFLLLRPKLLFTPTVARSTLMDSLALALSLSASNVLQ